MDYNLLVRDLNVELFEKNNQIQSIDQFTHVTDGFYDLIKFGDTILWCSDDDERLFDEVKNEYEPIEPFIKRVFNNHIEALNKLKF